MVQFSKKAVKTTYNFIEHNQKNCLEVWSNKMCSNNYANYRIIQKLYMYFFKSKIRTLVYYTACPRMGRIIISRKKNRTIRVKPEKTWNICCENFLFPKVAKKKLQLWRFFFIQPIFLPYLMIFQSWNLMKKDWENFRILIVSKPHYFMRTHYTRTWCVKYKQQLTTTPYRK